MPIGAPGKPTLVSPVRMPCWPVRNAARPAVQRLLAVVVEEADALLGDAIDVGRLVAHQAVAVGADVGDADVVAEDDEDVGFPARLRRGRPGDTQEHGKHHGPGDQSSQHLMNVCHVSFPTDG